MLGQRRLNQLDNFITNNNHLQNKMISPRNVVRTFNNNNNNYYNGFQEKVLQRPISPNRIVTTKKPMISKSPKKVTPKIKPRIDNDQNKQFYCSNESHRNKRAQYMIHIQDEYMYYCGVCATQAASQGFNVNRINSQKKQKTIPYLQNYANNKRYIQLTDLMKDILKLQNQFKNRDPKEIKEMYGYQTETLNAFYDDLIEVIQRMRNDHLDDFKVEQVKNIQSCQMYYENLKMHMDDLNQAWHDIQQTIQDVVERVDANDYEEGIRAYRNTLNIFKHKIQEYQDIINHFTNYDAKDLQNKIKIFQNNLLKLWENQENQRNDKKIVRNHINNNQKAVSVQNIKNGTMTLKNVHQNLPKPNQQNQGQGQGAFRNLFPDQSIEERLPQASPQFKNF